MKNCVIVIVLVVQVNSIGTKVNDVQDNDNRVGV